MSLNNHVSLTPYTLKSGTNQSTKGLIQLSVDKRSTYVLTFAIRAISRFCLDALGIAGSYSSPVLPGLFHPPPLPPYLFPLWFSAETIATSLCTTPRTRTVPSTNPTTAFTTFRMLMMTITSPAGWAAPGGQVVSNHTRNGILTSAADFIHPWIIDLCFLIPLP